MNKTMPIDHIFMPSTEQDTLGSNAWAVGGKHTENGKPMLASDPHLGLSIPSVFHMMEMTVVNEDDEV
jgi:penicillin amidase